MAKPNGSRSGEPPRKAVGTSPSAEGNSPNAGGNSQQRPEICRLIAEHHEAVYRYAYRLSGAVPDAEDLTQQVFLVAQQRLHQLREPDKARGWLYAVLRSVYLKSRRKPVPVPAANLELDVEGLAAPAVPEDGFDREELQAAITGLPDEFKLVVLMFYFEECSYKEIAEALEVPVGTVMSRLSRAKGRLREVLSVGLELSEGRVARAASAPLPSSITTFSANTPPSPRPAT